MFITVVSWISGLFQIKNPFNPRFLQNLSGKNTRNSDKTDGYDERRNDGDTQTNAVQIRFPRTS
jgi:hypothetical protein